LAEHIQDLNEKEVHDSVAFMARNIQSYYQSLRELNTDLTDYLGDYTEGKQLAEIGLYQPGGADILTSTTEEYSKLRVGKVRMKREGQSVSLYATARYKPEDGAKYETDSWGYTETEYYEAFKIVELSTQEARLIEEFVPTAVDKGDGFAGFRDNATKTNSLVDRLESIILPNVEDTIAELSRYVRTSERAEELQSNIDMTDQLLDRIVCHIYGLNANQIQVIESRLTE
jgi:hypothetical protein